MLAQETNQPFRRRANVPVASNISLLVQRMWIYGGSIIEKEGKKKKKKKKTPFFLLLESVAGRNTLGEFAKWAYNDRQAVERGGRAEWRINE